MSRKQLAPVGNNLYPVTEFDNESPTLPCQQMNNTSKMKAFKRRSYALNSLYKNVMNKRSSVDVMSIESPEKAPTSKSRSSTAKSSEVSSRVNSASSLSLTLTSDSRAPKTRNPISFYENNLNLARTSSSSSTVDLPSTRIKLPRRAHSSQDVNEVDHCRNEPIQEFPSKSSESQNERSHHVFQAADTSVSENDNDISRVLSHEISSALNDDILDRRFSFDNKWVDDAPFESFKDHNSMTSSGHSPLTNTLLPSSDKLISRRDSKILQDFEEDLNAFNSSKDKNRTSSSSKGTSSRLQQKLETLRLRSESARDNLYPSSYSPASESKASERYWATNTDFETKTVSDCVNREFKSVTRCNPYSGKPGGKAIVAILSQMPSEKRHEGQVRNHCSPPKNDTQSTHPTIENINCTEDDLLLASFLENNLQKNDKDVFEEKVLAAITDRELSSSIVRGRIQSCRMWLESEKLEFD